MIGLVVEGDGLHAVLFHVEQQKGWQYRWRMAGDYPEEYLKWRSGEATESHVIISPEAGFCFVEAEWRESSEHSWSQAALLRFLPGKATLRFTVREDRVLTGLHHQILAARANETGIARYKVWVPSGRLELKAGVSVELEGTADVGVLANVLREDGDLHAREENLEVINVGPSVGSWGYSDGLPRLKIIPEVARRELWVTPITSADS